MRFFMAIFMLLASLIGFVISYGLAYQQISKALGPSANQSQDSRYAGR